MHAFTKPTKLLELDKESESDYVDQLEIMFNRENVQIQHASKSWYTPYRRAVTDWMIDTVDSNPLNLTNLTGHLAVAYADRVFAMFDLPPEKLKLVACACILIAAKMVERNEDLPHTSDFMKPTDGIYSKELMFKMENEILEKFNWRMHIMTPMHFTQQFMVVAHTPHKDKIDGKLIPESAHVLSHIEKYAVFFADYSLQQGITCKHQPSRLACGYIYCARRALHIEPMWSYLLEHYTTYTINEIQDCADVVWAACAAEFPSHFKMITPKSTPK